MTNLTVTKLQQLDHPGLVIDLVYGTQHNFTGHIIYSNPQALLHEKAAACLYKAADLAQAMGLKLHIWDTYRSPHAQKILWQHLPDPRFVADPAIGSEHARAIAVDLTLEDENGQLLDMGTDFDEMREQSYHGRTDISVNAQKNRLLLLGLMQLAGFAFNRHEWWHYALPDAENYAFIAQTEDDAC